MIILIAILFAAGNLAVEYEALFPQDVPVLIAYPGTFSLEGSFAWGPYNFSRNYTLTGSFNSSSSLDFSVYSSSQWNFTCSCAEGSPIITTGEVTRANFAFRLSTGQYYMVIGSTSPTVTVTFVTALVARPEV